MITILPSNAFHGRGPEKGPSLVMTDDSSTEKGALKSVWPNSKQLLCIFHFLQRRWTWLYEGQNKIQQQDRAVLLNLVKSLVYAKQEVVLKNNFKEFLSNSTVVRYPKFLEHVKGLWPRRHEWAVCYRSLFPVRGNNTNNLAEAGVRILKEIVFSRVKAYNLVEMFQFVVDKLENYYQRRILSVAHSRFDRYVQVKFRGLHAGKIMAEHIERLPEYPDQFLVKSRRDPDSVYQIDMNIGTCTCIKGRDGSPCSHQLAVAMKCHKVSLNCIPTLHPSCRRQLAYIAVGSEANTDLCFYASVSQCADEATQPDIVIDDLPKPGAFPRMRDFSVDTDSASEDIVLPGESDSSDLLQELDSVIADLKIRLQQPDPNLRLGVKKFIDRYNKMKRSNSTALMTSSFHCFGRTPGGTITSVQGGSIRRGRRIPVQATAAGRRKYGSKGKAPSTVGRPPANKQKENLVPASSRFTLPLRNKAKGKRPHNLALSVVKGTQNAGKW